MNVILLSKLKMRGNFKIFCLSGLLIVFSYNTAGKSFSKFFIRQIIRNYAHPVMECGCAVVI